MTWRRGEALRFDVGAQTPRPEAPPTRAFARWYAHLVVHGAPWPAPTPAWGEEQWEHRRVSATLRIPGGPILAWQFRRPEPEQGSDEPGGLIEKVVQTMPDGRRSTWSDIRYEEVSPDRCRFASCEMVDPLGLRVTLEARWPEDETRAPDLVCREDATSRRGPPGRSPGSWTFRGGTFGR